MNIEPHRIQSRATEGSLRIPDLTDDTFEVGCLTIVVNAEIMAHGSSLNINADHLCPISQLVWERSLQVTTCDESTLFWRSICSNLSSELEALN